MIDYFYSGRLVLRNLEHKNILDLFRIIDYFNLTSLKQQASYYINSIITADNVLQTFQFAILHDYREFISKCLDFIDEHIEDPEINSNLNMLSEENLITIISRDSFCLSEIELYKLIKEWHIYNNFTQINPTIFKNIRLKLFKQEELVELLIELHNLDQNAILLDQVIVAQNESQYGKSFTSDIRLFGYESDERKITCFNRGSISQFSNEISKHGLIIKMSNPAKFNFINIQLKENLKG